MGVQEATLLSRYSTVSPTPFTNMAYFKESVTECYDDFVVGSSVHHQDMAFTNVTRSRFNKIDALCEARTSLPRMLILYDVIEEVLIVKIMPGILHNIAACLFHDMLLEKFIQLGVKKIIFPCGSS